MINELQKDFIRKLESLAGHRSTLDAFSDFCAAVSCSLEQMCADPEDRDKRYHDIMDKYSPDDRTRFVELFSIVVEALERRRESFLGPVLEDIGAANTRNGQFLTPVDLAKLVGRINAVDLERKPHRAGELLKLNDPACGAGVLMIQGAEEMVAAGVPRRDIYIVAGDIDHRACDITFIELTLLGYAARVEHANALTLQRLSRPRWTLGYFLNGTQHREVE